MKIKAKYGEGVITVPSSVLDILTDCDACQLKVLLFGLSHTDISIEDFSAETEISEKEIIDALTFWKKQGLIAVTGMKKAKPEPEKEKAEPAAETGEEKEKRRIPPEKHLLLNGSSLPSYNGTELSEFLRKNRQAKTLIDSCQQIYKKIFTYNEQETVVKLSDYLALSDEYIMLLAAHCVENGKKSLRYLETTAAALYDEGITDYESLEKHFEKADYAKSLEGQLKTMFGFGSRALTGSEKKYIMQWTEWGYGLDMIEKAYDYTCESASKFSMRYMNSIMENWYSAGIKTPKEADSAAEEFRKNSGKGSKKKAPKNAQLKDTSFDTKDFFEAALNRSYGEDSDN